MRVQESEVVLETLRNSICNVVVLFYKVNLSLAIFALIISSSELFKREEEQVVEGDLMAVTSENKHIVR